MNLISTFRQQHDQIEQVASEISEQLETNNIATNASEIRKKIRHFLTRLQIHTSLEEDALYSDLLHHQEHMIASEASRLMGETAVMTEEVETYRRHWLKSGVIESQPKEFIVQTQSLLTAINDRFNRENEELFNKVEETTH
jgi:hypothetical protein